MRIGAGRALHPLQAVHVHGRIERAHAGNVHDVGIGALLDQHGGQVVVRVDDREHERAGADALLGGLELVRLQRNVGLRERDGVQVRAEIGQRARGVDRAFSRREHERRPPATRKRRVGSAAARKLEDRRIERRGPGVDVRARFSEDTNRVGVILGGRPHHRRLAEPALARVDVGAAADEQLHGCRIAGTRRGQQYRLAFSGFRSRARAGFQQRIEDLDAAVGRRQCDRGDAVSVGGLRIGARAQQRLDQIDVVCPDREMERRGAIGLRDVDVRARAEQRPHRFAVASPGGVDERVRGLRASCGAEAQQQDQQPGLRVDFACGHEPRRRGDAETEGHTDGD